MSSPSNFPIDMFQSAVGHIMATKYAFKYYSLTQCESKRHMSEGNGRWAVIGCWMVLFTGSLSRPSSIQHKKRLCGVTNQTINVSSLQQSRGNMRLERWQNGRIVMDSKELYTSSIDLLPLLIDP